MSDLFDELAGRVLDGAASADDVERLDAMLREDPAARAEYLRLVNLHVALKTYGSGGGLTAMRPVDRAAAARDDAGSTGGAVPALLQNTRTEDGRGAWWRRGRARVAAVLLVGVTVAAAVMLGRNVPVGKVTPEGNIVRVGEFTRATGAKLAGGGVVVAGATVSPGELELVEGFAELTLTNGVRIVLEAPVKLDVPLKGDPTLLAGRLVATVPEGAQGFTVSTPTARVVDLGTEFGVGVAEGGGTEVQVFRGLVVTEWTSAEGGKRDQRLHAGDAMSIDHAVAGKSASAARDIPFQPERFVRMFPGAGSNTQPGGPVYNQPQVESVRVIPAAATGIRVDGDLADWGAAGAFRSVCVAPYDTSHFVEGRMRYDGGRLYIGAHVGDPAPMRSTVDPRAAKDEYAWRGGSVIVRLASDPKAGWPLDAIGTSEKNSKHPEWGRRPQDRSDRIVHLTMWFHRPTGKARLHVAYGMDFHGERMDPGGVAWEGAFREDADGLGYTLEYAIPWEVLNAAAPKGGEVMASQWTVHWSDRDGKLSRGHLVDVANSAAGPAKFSKGVTWGKAVFEGK
ncbi:MAG: FecR domain-containing protein [Phycisphaerae bacterium]|nr:FecR domain-containing protein [Tepidisphaeraceae bacterium]